MGLLNYLLIFASYWNSAISYILPGNLSHQGYVLIVAILTLLLLIRNVLVVQKGIVTIRFFMVCCMSLLIAIMFYSAKFFYGPPGRIYSSFWRALLIQSVPTVLYGSCIANNKNCLVQMKRMAPIIAIVFTVVSAASVFAPTTITAGGFSDTDYGLNYQTSSYMAAYAAGFAEFNSLFDKKFDWYPVFKKKWIKYLMTALIIVDAVTILISGGRGGLAVFGIELIVTFIIMLRIKKTTVRQLIKYLGIVLGVAVIGFYSIRYAMNSNVATSGFKRIVSAVVEGDTAGRDLIHERALQVFKTKPILGNGLGSVFYLLGNHAHSVFYDLLVESGIIGLSLFLIILFLFGMKLKRIIQSDITNCVLIYIFLDGFIMALFSSYFLVQLPMLWCFAFVFSKTQTKNNLNFSENI